MATEATFKNDVKSIKQQILPANTTTWVDVVDNSAGTKAVRVEALNICSDDTNTVNIQFSRLSGGTNYLIGTVRVATLWFIRCSRKLVKYTISYCTN